MQHLQKTGVYALQAKSLSLFRSLPRYFFTSLLRAPLLARANGGPAGKDGGGEAAAGSEFAADDAPFGANGGDDVAEDFVDGVFVKDAEAAVGEKIHFQGFQLDAILLRHVLDGDGAEVGETGLGAHGGVFGKARGDDVAGKLIGPRLECWQFCVDAGAGVFCGVVGHECSSNLLYRDEGPYQSRTASCRGGHCLLRNSAFTCARFPAMRKLSSPFRQWRYRLRVRT